MPSLNVKTLAIGCLLGVVSYTLARLLFATALQAFVLGAWLAIVPIYLYPAFVQIRAVPHHPIRSITSMVVTPLFMFIVMVLPSFGYALDIKLMIMIAAGSIALWFVWNGSLHLPLWTQRGCTAVLICACLFIASRTLSPCTILPCQAHTWDEQRRFAEQIARQQGPDVLLDGVFVNLESQTTYWLSAPPALRISFSFTHTTPSTNPQTSLPYATNFFTFNDYDPAKSISVSNGDGWQLNAPDPKWQSGLQQVQISPRTALGISMPVGVQFLSRPPQVGDIQMSLYAKEALPATIMARHAWKVTFVKLETHQQLELWIDAVSGELLQKTVK